MCCIYFIMYNIKNKGDEYMSWVEKIIQNKNLQDIPILHVICVVNEIQKEIINEQSSSVCENIFTNNK